MFNTILTSLENGILTATINRPDKMNALNKQVMQDLGALTAHIEETAAVKGAIITGSGQKAFVAGADISEFIGLSGSEGMDLARRGQEIFFKIENACKPIIAA